MSITDFEKIKHIIKTRRAVFPPHYTNREITKETLVDLLECANAAPTHKLTQPWRFSIFRGMGLPRLADKLAELYQKNTPPTLFLQKKYEVTREKVLQSGAVIAICVHYSGDVPEWEELAATACAVQNLWLASAAAGIGGYWSSPATAKQLGDFLGLAGSEECLGLFYMGYHHEPLRDAIRKPISERIRWEEE